MKRFLLAVLVFSIAISVPVSAVWEEVETDAFLEAGRSSFAEGLLVKANNVNAKEGYADVTITRNKNKLFEGRITQDKAYTLKGVVRIKAAEFDYEYQNPRVRLAVEKWESANIKKVNFPEEMYKLDELKVYAVITNTAKRDTVFNVELSATNSQVGTSSQEATTRYSSTISNYKNTTSQTVSLKSGESKKVYFEIQPGSNEGTISPTLRIYSESGQLIKQEDIEDIEIVNEQVGYIEDILLPEGVLSGSLAEVKVRVRNSWMVASNDFYIKLTAPEFKIEKATKRIKADSGNTEEVVFEIKPYGGGDFTVIADLSIGQRLEDTASADITAIGEKVYKIENVEGPDRIIPGRSEPIFITVRNNGVERNTLSLQIDSDDFSIGTPAAVIRLSGQESTRALFNIRPKTDAEYGTYTVKLYDEAESAYDKKIQTRKLIHSIEKRVKIGKEEETGTSTTTDDTTEEEPVETEPDVEEDDPEPSETEQEPDEVNEVEEEATWMEEYWQYAAIGIGVLILIILIVIAVSKKKPDVEVYDLDKTVNKKSKKR